MRGRTRDIPLSLYLPVRTLVLEVLDGVDRGLAVTPSADGATVGTAAGNDLTLHDESVSGYHLELTSGADGISVRDCGSTNGTYVGAVRINEGVVPAGTVLQLGHSKLRVGGGEQALVELHGDDSFGESRGRTPEMRRLFARLKKAAATDFSVLLVGESGTGKELLARAIHAASARAEQPMVTVDCGALAPNLVASELFGHERGAFTGADTQRSGAFEQAHGGTLFLDEVGELPAELQSNLLGVLERRRFRRVGGSDEIAVDVRVVAATNRDLRGEVNAGGFRLDLYYRLAVITAEVPPLRDRAEDIELLITHFLSKAGHEGPVGEVFSRAALVQLLRHHWPGNVRELRNVVEASLAMGESFDLGSSQTAASAGPAWPIHLPYNDARAKLLHEFERRYLDHLLERADGNVSRAAREAQMTRSHLFTLLRRHNLR